MIEFDGAAYPVDYEYDVVGRGHDEKQNFCQREAGGEVTCAAFFGSRDLSLQKSSLVGYWVIAVTLSIVIRMLAVLGSPVLLLLASTNNWFDEMREKIHDKFKFHSASSRRRSSEFTRESVLSDECEMSEDPR